jgi:putative protease
LRIFARARGHQVDVVSTTELAASTSAGLTDALLRDKLAGFGGTPFRLGRLDVSALGAQLHLPVSELKSLRRGIVDALQPRIERGSVRVLEAEPQVPKLRARARSSKAPQCESTTEPTLLALCRNEAQLEAVIAAGLRDVELDWMELVGLKFAVERARAAGLRVTLATVRVQKPGEESYDRRLAALAPDAVLVRHWGALVYFQQLAGARPVLHGDFSLNVTNSVTAAELFERGLDTLTASHDLDEAQLGALLDAAPAERFTISLHHRIATFPTEHCVYSHLLSAGRDFNTCGRPCEKHEVALRDQLGRAHPVIVDVACRNTVFNAHAQSAAALVPDLLKRGVRRFRVEFVRESADEAARVLAAYRELLGGAITPAEAAARAGANAHYGVSRAPMAVLR